MIADREFDALLRSVLADEAANVVEMAPSLDHAVATLRPRVHNQAGGTRRLMLLLAAALLLVAVLASAIAVGGLLRNTIDKPSSYIEEFRAVGVLPADMVPQAVVAETDGNALLIASYRISANTSPISVLLRFDRVEGTFTEAGALQIRRDGFAATVLQDGRLLIVGGGHGDYESSAPPPPDVDRAEIYDPATARSTFTGAQINPRSESTATLLEDGRVLVSGGVVPQGYAVATAELFDPRRGEFVATGSMSRARYGHAAILLDDGRVLVIGGDGSDDPASAELYDPEMGSFVPTGPVAVPQATGFTATQLADGRVLIVGGWDPDGQLLAAAQIYDPATGRFTETGSLPAARQRHSAALLHDGRVLIVGGWDGSDDAIAEGDDAFIFDPDTDTFTPTASLTVQRLAPFVVTLTDGRVLVVGSRCWNNGCYGLGEPPSATNREISAEVFR
jgi:Galactose oxidase, central domain/Kelch motif